MARPQFKPPPEVAPEDLAALRERLGPLPVPVDALGRPTRRLTLEDETALADRYQTYGDTDARNVLVIAHEHFVKRYAAKFASNAQGASYDDVVNVGFTGAIRAAKTFDGRKGFRFLTYAQHWMRSYIQRYLLRTGKDIRPPMQIFVKDDARRRTYHNLKAPVVWLDEAPARHDGGQESEEKTNYDIFSPSEMPAFDIETESTNAYVREAVETTLASVRPRKRDQMRVIVERRLLAETPSTLDEVGKQLDMSREGVRLIEKMFLTALRKNLRG